jgi:hypothetical protein
VALVRTDVSDERISSMNRVERISEQGTALAVVTANVPSSLILCTLMMEEIRSSETSVLTNTTLGHISEYGILHGLAD